MKSIEESKIFDLNYYRFSLDNNNKSKELFDYVILNKVDVCKVKIPFVNYNEINQIFLSFPWHSLSNINTLNEIIIDCCEDLVLDVRYTISEITSMLAIEEFIKDSVINKGWQNAQPKYISSYLDKESQLKASTIWVEKYLNKPNKLLYSLEFNGEVVGFFSGDVINDEFYGGIFGIHSDYRGKGHSKMIYLKVIELCKKLNLKRFACEVGITNIGSQKSAEKSGLKVIGQVFNLEIYPFLSQVYKNNNTLFFYDFKGNDQLISTMFKSHLNVVSKNVIENVKNQNPNKSIISIIYQDSKEVYFVIIQNVKDNCTYFYYRANLM